MLTILTTTDLKGKVKKVINSIDRLNELVRIITQPDLLDSGRLFIIEEGYINICLDWHDREFPYLFFPVEFSDNYLLALVFYRLGNFQKVFEFITSQDFLYNHLKIAICLSSGEYISEKQFAFLKMTYLHNQCVVYHYGNHSKSISPLKLQEMYKKAIIDSESNDLRVFTAKQYVGFLLDNQLFSEAKKFMMTLDKENLSLEANNAADMQLATVLKVGLEFPYDKELLKRVQDLYQQGICFYEHRKLKINEGLLMIDASEIAGYQKEFDFAKKLINKAIYYFEEESLPEFLGEAKLQKARLFYTWSKNDHPQYYKLAINAFQGALKFFDEKIFPEKFADIHHNLALIYSEMPVALEEKAIWAAFCVSSFKKALAFYKQNFYPYEYAMVSHNYATALMSFPESKSRNNLKKAFDLFEQALSFRKALTYPFERALTLLNQLELYWQIPNEEGEQEMDKYQIMLCKANEVKKLVTDKYLIDKLNIHFKKLQKIKPLIK